MPLPLGGGGARKGKREHLVPHPEEQEIRNQILELRTEGFGPYRIAGALNRDGVKNPRTTGLWSQGTIASILRTADRLDRVAGQKIVHET